MISHEEIINRLKAVIHPETGENIIDGGIVTSVAADDDNITVNITFRKAKDPFASRIQRNIREVLREAAPQASVEIAVTDRKPAAHQPAEHKSFAGHIGKVIAIASGKGGVGKSTVAANLAVALRDKGFRTGLLDADIYGPSQPKMFGCEDYMPAAERVDGEDVILPIAVQGIKLMSLGFFVQPTDAMLWRGPMATSALRQLIHQTKWGELDFLLVDLPPGTGDVHLSLISELKINGAVIVSTPQQVAVADVTRGVNMFRNPSVNVPVVGIIENMAWFTPAELPQNRYYIFGREGAVKYAVENGIDVLGQIPLVQSIAEGADNGEPIASGDSPTAEAYREIAQKIVEKCAIIG